MQPQVSSKDESRAPANARPASGSGTLAGDHRSVLARAVTSLRQDLGWLELDWLELERHAQAIATRYGILDVDTLRKRAAILAALCGEHVALGEPLGRSQAPKRIESIDPLPWLTISWRGIEPPLVS